MKFYATRRNIFSSSSSSSKKCKNISSLKAWSSAVFFYLFDITSPWEGRRTLSCYSKFNLFHSIKLLYHSVTKNKGNRKNRIFLVHPSVCQLLMKLFSPLKFISQIFSSFREAAKDKDCACVERRIQFN